MTAQITIGHESSGKPVEFDIEELLATRLLVQGNSGSGKSHLLRRLLEESAGMVQQVVIDPEGDFPSLADEFGHVVIDGAAYSPGEIEALARRVPSVRLRYEDFVREPSASTARVLRLAEVEAGPPDIGPSGVQLGPSHSCAGNPMRFVQGPVQVRCDERWRTEQDLGVRRLVTTLTKPLLHRYHYST